ncbi:TPA_asm: tyrosine-type recombinase/integrase [Salmonella enterica subsp. houtenae serovar 16:z4,z32:-]|uniref:Tyrosine-type recombinase/integrase n=1 Tax=Salmonella enterica subsp. houtenae serovar 16:z4,z32:- TaxID=1307497 RepID=A0A735L2E8_SALHO|nr:integrase [Salmonella enterica]EDL1780610.1 integrase [Salmonella enterica subsp. enterica serovar Poona]EDQ6564413.1 tyrosine-type recombinase/integrase [Salmonella enterica subsp. houtenae]EDS7537888.1 tyrosine-type recombinase/integrase [Salmonella enterica subsp. enterica]EED5528475.1 tyrosine-type recombinase/integrase [Salmonella enterica subsp. enterica serovar Muenchen]EGI6407029.1 tyrosine-type recombinase/integrase [Salmonella enterica subsp. houtenae serovar 16:z4,z32:-]ENZ84100
MTPLAPHLTSFLLERLKLHQQASPNTCDTYAYAFQLLLNFASKRLKTTPSSLAIEQLDERLILDFLTHLQLERNNTPRTRNSRLAAIKSFMRFLQYRVPTALEQINRILAIPIQRMDRNLVRHLKREEEQALLDATDPTTRIGIRDRAMVHLALAGGLRVSELVGLRMDDLHFNNSNVDLLVRGKGRKQRELRLWKSVAQSIRAWLSVRGHATVPELFLNAQGKQMTRAGFEYVLERCRVKAVKQCPSLVEKKLSPHVLRHTCALTVLKATGDLRQVALWLGHESTATTECYLQLDPLEKLQSIAGFVPTSLKPGKFRPSDRLIAMLRGDNIM